MTGWNLAEVAPAAPALAELLPPLAMLCILIICFGIVHGIDAVVRGFFGTVSGLVGWIPFAGKVVEAPIHKIEQKIVSFLAGLEQDIDHAIGHFWHSLASTVEHLWHLLARDSLIAWNALKFLTGVPTLHELLHAEQWLRRDITRAEAEAAHALRHAIRYEERSLRSVAHNIYPRIKAIEHEVDRTLPREIRHARDLAREAEDGVARLWKAVKALPGIREVDAAIAAAIAALGLVGLDLLKCAESSNLFGKRGCGLWTALDDLLGLLFDAVLFVDLCNLLPELETLFAELEAPLVSLISSAADAACAHPPAGWAELSAPALSLPTVYYAGAAIG